MAFTLRNLSVLAYANGFTLWHYKAGMDGDAASARGFFDDADTMLSSGDMVMVSGEGGGRVLCVVSEGGQVATAPLG